MKKLIYIISSFLIMSDSFSDSDDDMSKHYKHLERRHRSNLAPVPVYNIVPRKRPPINIIAEKIIEAKDDNYMKILTNFSISEFLEIFDVISPIITKGAHRGAILSPKSALLLTLCHLKHNEGWRKIGANFNINYSYAFQKVRDIINNCSMVLRLKFIKWISVNQRINQYHQRYQDWPALLGSVDATVQLISVPAQNEKDYYSGKHKSHVIKVQAFVSPVGLLIHHSKSVPGTVHDFNLLQQSGLIDLIKKENSKVQESLGCDATVLADAGYQGFTKLFDGAVTPKKTTRRIKSGRHHQQ